MMASSKTSIPDVLKKKRCFLHIDLDCFFAQVEQIRLGLPADVPLVSQQWNAIIAVNYTARKYGISRLHHSVFEAKQLCPEVVCAHVATIGPGDSQPDYYPSPSRYTHKVSLDPYRKASAKIFSVFRKYCTTSQKGGLDEVFMDVTDIVNQRIMDEYGKDLSRWDRAKAEMLHWERDHPEAGVVFGLVKDDGSAALEVSLDDEDDYELGKEDREEDDELEGGQRHDEVERDEAELQDPTTQSGPTTATAMGEEVSEDDEFGFKDDDFDWEALAAIEEIEENLTQERLAASQSQVVHTQEQLPSWNNLNQPTALTAPEMTAEQIQQQQQEADEAREKAEQAERLRQEKVFLLPYYGVPEGTFEEQFWAEMQLLKAAEFCNEIRKAVKDELGYTCSAGISNNRLLAKLGSGMNKPYQQTIILPRYIPDLMHGVKLSKIRGLGGKFGHRVKTDFQIERASQLWPVPLRRLQEKYSPQTGLDLWQWCRGIDPVGIRKIKSKSMCSHKSFIPALSDLEEIEYWIQTMCRELVSRMEAEYIETSRWPRTISLGFFGGIRADRERSESSGQGSAWAPPSKGSRQMAMGGRLDYGGVDGLTRKMFRAVEKLIQDGREGRIRPVLPLIILTVTASNFDAGGHSAKDIASFFTKSLQSLPTQSLPPVPSSTAGSEASGKGGNRSLSAEVQTELLNVPVDTREAAPTARASQPNIKSNKPSTSASSSSARKRFFGGIKFSQSPSASSPSPSSSSLPYLTSSDSQMENPMSEDSAPPSSPGMDCDGEEPRSAAAPAIDSPYASSPSMTVRCTQCPPPGQDIPASEWDEHQDYHFALSLHNDERQQHQQQQQQQNHKRPQEASGSSTRGRRKKAKPSSSAGVGGNGSSADHQARSSPASNGAADNSKLLTNFFKPSS